jgi:ribosome assembly protein YihI (activator of Der GTPase)
MEERFDQKLDKKFAEYTNLVLDRLDAVMAELEIIREENIFMQAQINRIKDKIGIT